MVGIGDRLQLKGHVCGASQARAAARAFNTLLDRVAADAEYLEATLAAAAEYDGFTVRTEHSTRVYRSIPCTRLCEALVQGIAAPLTQCLPLLT